MRQECQPTRAQDTGLLQSAGAVRAVLPLRNADVLSLPRAFPLPYFQSILFLSAGSSPHPIPFLPALAPSRVWLPSVSLHLPSVLPPSRVCTALLEHFLGSLPPAELSSSSSACPVSPSRSAGPCGPLQLCLSTDPGLWALCALPDALPGTHFSFSSSLPGNNNNFTPSSNGPSLVKLPSPGAGAVAPSGL